MAVDIVIPSAGESVTSGVISRWTRKDGEYVNRDDTVLELETDKVTMEVPAPGAGVVRIKAKEGDTVSIGQVVGSIEPGAAPAKPEAKSEVKAETRAEAKAEPAAADAKAADAKPAAVSASAGAPATDIRATPLARKVAAEHNVDLGQIRGTGAGHRVREQDVLGFVQRSTTGPAEGAAAGERNGKPAAPSTAGVRGSRRERMTPIRQRIAQRLVQAQHTAAMLTTFNEVDMTAVMELRKTYKEEFEKRHAVGLGFMGFFVKAVAAALKAFPLVNSFIVQDEEGYPAIERHDYCDVAVAVSTPKGLVVPVLRGCEQLSMAQIESGIKDLATRARDGKLALEDMQGGTFTITNGGIFGSLMSTPILNPPQSAILGMHAIKNRAVEHPVNSGQVAIRPMMYLALSYDHRVIDGAEAVQFLVRVKQGIEDPQRLLLEI